MLTITTIPVTTYEQNARVVVDKSAGKALVIDPGGEPQKLLSACEPEKNRLNAVVLTHGHVDHAACAGKLLDLAAEKAPRPFLYYHSKDQFYLDRLPDTALDRGFEGYACPKPNLYLDDLTQLQFGMTTIRLLYSPGHSPGHVALYFPEGDFELKNGNVTQRHRGGILISGDALFRMAIGRTDLPGGSMETLLQSIRSQFFSLPDETLVLSGHGADSAIGFEKKNNPFFQ